MIQAEFGIVGLRELATPEGKGPRTGSELGRLRIVEDAAVAISGGRFVFVGTREEYRATVTLADGGRELDAGGGTALPAFVDAHTHLPFAGWRETEFDERLRGATYSEIAARGGGILSTVARTREAGLEQLSRNVRERLDAMAALGTGIVEAKSGYGLTPDDELKQLEAIRQGAEGHPVEVVPTFLGAHTVPMELRGNRERYLLQVMREMLPRVEASGLAEYADVFVDEHAFKLDEARMVLESALERGLGVRVHADQLADDGGARLAAELGAASADHLEYASDAGIEAMARAGTCGVLLPAASFFLRCDVMPPGRKLADAGVPVVVASDFNPGTCPSESVATAIWFACLNGGLGVDEAITASTLNAAHSLGRAADAGSIELGKRGDLVIHDMPNRYHLVYRFGVSRIGTVVLGGQVVRSQGTAWPV